jgi:GR25 family glycosyltransferase involved in LPS biosynthesis
MEPDITGCWDYFDRIYCVSLLERDDRRARAKVRFSGIGISADKVNFMLVKKHPFDCEQGIYEAHMACIKKGLSENANNIVIFEDDVIFNRFSSDRLRDSIDFLTENDWNAFFFGCLIKQSWKTNNLSVFKIKYRTLAHAYVLNRPFAEVLIRQPWHGIAFDDLLAGFNHKFYAIRPAFAFQDNSRSDNKAHLILDMVRRWCGGLERIQKINEFYYCHKTLIIILHVVALMFIVLFLM